MSIMTGSRLHDYEVRLVRYVLSNLVQQLDDPAYLACLERRLSPTLFAYICNFAEDAVAVPTVLLNEKELEQLRVAVCEHWDFDDTWQRWEPLHRLSVNCVPEIREHLTQHHAEEWATASDRFADRLSGDSVRLRDGIETVSEWVDEIHRLLRAMGATPLLPRPEGRFPTPSHSGDSPVVDLELAATRGTRQSHQPMVQTPETGPSERSLVPRELSRQDAATYLGVSVETVEKFQKGGLIRYRNASPEGSGKPRFRYPIADLDQFMQKGYRRDVPGSAKRPTPRRKREQQSYPHLDLD